jgi:hypothetical protein
MRTSCSNFRCASTSIEEAIIMKKTVPTPVQLIDESDDEEVDTTVANTSRPWQTDYGNALPCYDRIRWPED